MNDKLSEMNKRSTSKYLFKVEFKVAKNAMLDFSFGKDFDNTIDRGGNLLSILNFVKSFETEEDSN